MNKQMELMFKRIIPKTLSYDQEKVMEKYGYIYHSLTTERYMTFSEIQEDFNKQMVSDEINIKEFCYSSFWQHTALMYLTSVDLCEMKLIIKYF